MEKRTDLALEANEIYNEDNNESPKGVTVDTKTFNKITVTTVKIIDSSGEEALGKPKGNYITLEIPELIHKTEQSYRDTIKVLSQKLDELININENKTVLVVGLGNSKISADALGPKVVSQLLVTRHLFQYMPEELEDGIRPVCALSPGVLGITGIETGEILKGVVERIKPDLLIVIDALASRKLQRVSTTIQLSDTGLVPGSGIGNSRMAINNETMGVPVIAIGVPTVVDAATMANDTIDLVLDKLISQSKSSPQFYKILNNVDKNEKYALINEILTKEYINLVVTPKEVDEIIEDISEIIANGINISLHKVVTIDDINKYK